MCACVCVCVYMCVCVCVCVHVCENKEAKLLKSEALLLFTVYLWSNSDLHDRFIEKKKKKNQSTNY